MGCDIHLYIEAKSDRYNKDRWVCIDNWILNPYYEKDNDEKYEHRSLYSHRDYRLFATLADVRNNSSNPVISQPKGLPNDCSDVIKAESDEYGADGHSHSYLTLAELINFRNVHPGTKYSGMVSPENAKILDAGGDIDSWCLSTSDQSHVYREWSRPKSPLDELIKTVQQHALNLYLVYVENDLYKIVNDVRIVFWFDN